MSRQVSAVRMNAKMREHAEAAQRTMRANIVTLAPLTVDVESSGLLLSEDDDFNLSATVRLLIKTVPLKVDDTVLLHRESGTYVLFDVVTDSTV